MVKIQHKLPLFLLLMAAKPALATEVSQDPIGDARAAIREEADFDAARILLEAFESYALEATPSASAQSLADMNFLMGVMEYYLNQDEEAAKARWAWTLQIFSDYRWDEELVGGAGQDLFEEVRQSVAASPVFALVEESETLGLPVFFDGNKLQSGSMVRPGQHLIQARCSDGVVRGVYAYVAMDADLLCPCPLDACVGEGGGASESPRKKKKQASDVGQLGISLVGGGWFSSGEGFSPLIGLGASYRPLDMVQVDLEAGSYLSNAQAKRTNGGFARVAGSYVHALGSIEAFGGAQLTILFAQDLYDMSDGSVVEASYSGLVIGAHAGAAYTLAGGHQVGARLAYTPLVLEGELMVYMNTMTDVFFRYSF